MQQLRTNQPYGLLPEPPFPLTKEEHQQVKDVREMEVEDLCLQENKSWFSSEAAWEKFMASFSSPQFIPARDDEDVTTGASEDQAVPLSPHNRKRTPKHLKRKATQPSSVKKRATSVERYAGLEQFYKFLRTLRPEQVYQSIKKQFTPFTEEDHSGHKVHITIDNTCYLDVRFTFEDFTSEWEAGTREGNFYYFEIFERIEGQPDDQSEIVASLRFSADRQTGEWMWIRSGLKTGGRNSKALAKEISSALAIKAVRLADTAKVKATGYDETTKLALSVFRQVIYGSERGPYYADCGFRLLNTQGDLRTKLDWDGTGNLVANQDRDAHDLALRHIQDLSGHDLIKYMFVDQRELKNIFKQYHLTLDSNLGTLLGEVKKANNYEHLSDLSLFCLNHKQVRPSRRARSRYTDRQKRKIQEFNAERKSIIRDLTTLLHNVIYEADFSRQQ